MTILKEFRIVLPIKVSEYYIAQLYAVAEESKLQTGGGEGVTVVQNEPFDNERGRGQYTYKIYRLDQKVPSVIRSIAPKGSLVFHEKAWNSYPNCYTEYTNEYFQEKFQFIIVSKHIGDRGTSENVFDLDKKAKNGLQVEFLNIADNNVLDKRKYAEETDPTLVKSQRTSILPLARDFSQSCSPVMCCYKHYTINCRFPMVGGMIERTLASNVVQFLIEFHRKMMCWVDRWKDMTLDQLRAFEEETKKVLDDKLNDHSVKVQSTD